MPVLPLLYGTSVLCGPWQCFLSTGLLKATAATNPQQKISIYHRGGSDFTVNLPHTSCSPKEREGGEKKEMPSAFIEMYLLKVPDSFMKIAHYIIFADVEC